MKTIALIYLLVLAFSLSSQAQGKDNLILPSPIIGWDSVSNLMPYPELARRAGIQGGYLVKLLIDTSGTIQRVNLYELTYFQNQVDTTNFFSYFLYHSINKTKWFPATRNGKNIDFTITIPIVFTVKLEGQVDPIIKNIPRAIIQVEY